MSIAPRMHAPDRRASCYTPFVSLALGLVGALGGVFSFGATGGGGPGLVRPPAQMEELSQLPRVSAHVRTGPLDDIRSEVHGGGDDDDDDDDDDSSGGGGGFCFSCDDDGTVGSGDGTAVQLDGFASRRNWPHPYYDGAPGYYVNERDPPNPAIRSWNLRAQASAAWVAQGLWRMGLGARAGANFFEFDTSWDAYYDPVEVDALTIGDFNVGISPVRGRRFVMRAGVGARVMFDTKPAVEGESGPAAGFNAMAGFTLFPKRPVVVEADFDIGNLGKAFYWRALGQLGVMMGPLELFGGVDYTKIGNVGLFGVNFGLGVWF